MATYQLPPLLIKFGSEKNIRRFAEQGSMKFSTFGEFRTAPDDPFLRNQSGRFDPLEGLEKQIKGKATFKIANTQLFSKPVDATVNIYQNQYQRIFCAYGAAHRVKPNYSIDRRMKEYFGDYAVVFNSKTFLTHVANLLYGTRFHMGYVAYYPEDIFFNNLGPFSKKSKYDFQYEYRIATTLENSILNIGDFLISQPDTHILPSDEILKAKFVIG